MKFYPKEEWLEDLDAEFIQPPPPPVFAVPRNVLLTGGAPHSDTFWQSPLVTLITILALGLWLQLHCPVWHEDHSTALRKATFNVLLPCYVLQSMWGASPIDTTLLPVAAYSFATHTIMAVVTAMLFLRVADRQIRGWLCMSAQGALLSFLYPRLAADSRFGERSPLGHRSLLRSSLWRQRRLARVRRRQPACHA
ncbi:hypothetical protein FOZ63_019258 [Perkinsus olseni]|uniref:Uncharacterized protein n=1 Tax=Perkinsus olseni TaxID=32597 RepID=A0A7J6S311_PEROL|nr:hypothetical protein FOZ63_019258 [Perkinsus olseni]